jgi:predicted  nucleic acid-binding Zn-ribbon protein
MSDVYISSNEFERLHNDISSLQEEIKAQRRYYEDEYAKLWQMYGDLEEERDRLREALEWTRDMIIERTTINDQKFYRPTVEKIRAALQETSDDNT